MYCIQLNLISFKTVPIHIIPLTVQVGIYCVADFNESSNVAEEHHLN